MKKLTTLGVAMATAGLMGLYGQQINPMTEAVLRNYAEILEENPKDYYTLYDRASQYYDLGQYDRALSDIEMALEYTPASDQAYKMAEYSLKSDILTAQKDYSAAIEALNSALAINPVSKLELFKSGTLYLINNEPENALKAFERLQRESPRSQEAFYGMARANAMMGKTGEAEKLIKEIENLGKQNYITYCRIGDLYADMGNIKEATTNYAIAYSMDENSNRASESLKILARKNPTEVMGTLDGIMASNSDNVPLNYLKAILAFDGGMYAGAENACKDIAAAVEEESPAIYRMMAMAQLMQNKTADAKESIANAERLAPDDMGVLLDKAEIYMNLDPSTAYMAAGKAARTNPDDPGALKTAAKAAMMAEKYEEARDYLNNLILANPGNAEAVLLRGYLNSEYLKDGKAGVADYTRAGNIKGNGDVRDLTMQALGKAKSGKKLDADGLIKEASEKASGDKDALYMIAVYYSQTGDLEKAKEYADKALLSGYNNLYNLQSNDEPLFNLRPIRHLLGK